MPHTPIPTTEPTELVAGMSWQWDRVDAEHPAADGWVLKYAFRGPTDLDVTATASGDTWQVRIAPKDTLLAPGRYRLAGFFELGAPPTDRHIVYSGTVIVHPSPLGAVNAQTHAERTLAVIEAALEGRLDADMQSYSIAGRAVNMIPIAELQRLRGQYAALVKRERSRRLGRLVEVRFA